MSKIFKHQGLMKEKGVSEPCPFHHCTEAEMLAYHFGFSYEGEKENFVPGHKSRSRINAENDMVNCAYCGLSMFKTESSARRKWTKELPARARLLMKYTHLLEGKIKKELGVMSIEKGNHFTFFEYEGVELKEHFRELDRI